MLIESNKVPETLVMAQEFQKAHEYSLSRRLYKEFFVSHPNHYLRFKHFLKLQIIGTMKRNLMKH